MTDAPKLGEISYLDPKKIDRNPDNPRLFFREAELETLQASIRRFGIQVPVTVYRDRGRYHLLDGERRWLCALKLNLPTIPALIHEKPSTLSNLLLMFNIHALREQWDYLTIASKLPDVIRLFEEEHGRAPNEIELSESTGLSRGQIRRCRLLLDLPSKYVDLLKEELELPKSKQRISEDLLIEMERALKTVRKRFPETVKNANNVRNVLIKKFRAGHIRNVTDFRKLSKIATSVANLNVKSSVARNAIQTVFDGSNESGISEIYADHFEMRYDERKINQTLDTVSEFLEALIDAGDPGDVSGDLKRRLRKLTTLIEQLLE